MEPLFLPSKKKWFVSFPHTHFYATYISYRSSSFSFVCSSLISTIDATFGNMIHRSSRIRASTFWMDDVDMQTGWLSSCYICLYRFKEFWELIQISVIYGACSILHHTPLMDFRTFDPICPKKAQYRVLFLSEWNVYRAGLIAHCHLTEQLNAERLATRHPMRTRSVVCNFNIAFTLWFILVYFRHYEICCL